MSMVDRAPSSSIYWRSIQKNDGLGFISFEKAFTVYYLWAHGLSAHGLMGSRARVCFTNGLRGCNGDTSC
jgi:hypothetical protein